MSEHHVLLLEPQDLRSLITAYLKCDQNKGKEIYTKNSIKGAFKQPNAKNSTLYIIAHGVKAGFTEEKALNLTPKYVAELIFLSGLPNILSSKVNLQVCYGGYGGKDSLANRIRVELKEIYKKRGKSCNIRITGGVDILIPGWNMIGPKRKYLKRQTFVCLPDPDDERTPYISKKDWDAGALKVFNFMMANPEPDYKLETIITENSQPSYIFIRAKLLSKLPKCYEWFNELYNTYHQAYPYPKEHHKKMTAWKQSFPPKIPKRIIKGDI